MGGQTGIKPRAGIHVLVYAPIEARRTNGVIGKMMSPGFSKPGPTANMSTGCPEPADVPEGGRILAEDDPTNREVLLACWSCVDSRRPSSGQGTGVLAGPEPFAVRPDLWIVRCLKWMDGVTATKAIRRQRITRVDGTSVPNRLDRTCARNASAVLSRCRHGRLCHQTRGARNRSGALRRWLPFLGPQKRNLSNVRATPMALVRTPAGGCAFSRPLRRKSCVNPSSTMTLDHSESA